MFVTNRQINAELLSRRARAATVELTPDATLPLRLSNALTGHDMFEKANWGFERLEVDGVSFYVLVDATPAQWTAMPLANHSLDPQKVTRRKHFEPALRMIASRPWFFQVVADNLTTLVPVGAAEPGLVSQVVTSCTLPVVPFCGFFSEKALYTMPPETEHSSCSDVILAENILHEATHNRVNREILTQRLIHPTYDARKTPKVPIPWRTHVNEAWEFDRMLHAAAVYAMLVPWRHAVLEDTAIASEELRGQVRDALDQAVASLEFLSSVLVSAPAFLTSAGRRYIADVVEPVLMSAEWG